jgi:gliding motility-associated-like protein
MIRKLLLLIIFIIWYAVSNGQQVIELCPENRNTFTYSSNASEDGIYTWLYNGMVFNGEDLTITWTEPGFYTIEVQFESSNCLSSIQYYEVLIKSCPKTGLSIPNAFTPNRDGINDSFFALGENITDIRLLIFNRWGENLFNSNTGWDGTYRNELCPEGVYVYVISWVDSQNLSHKEIGKVVLLR